MSTTYNFLAHQNTQLFAKHGYHMYTCTSAAVLILYSSAQVPTWKGFPSPCSRTWRRRRATPRAAGGRTRRATTSRRPYAVCSGGPSGMRDPRCRGSWFRGASEGRVCQKPAFL